MADAETADRPASQVVQKFMRDYVRRQREARDHESWFRAEVEKGIAEADDPNIRRISSEEIAANWRVQRAELLKRVSDPEA